MHFGTSEVYLHGPAVALVLQSTALTCFLKLSPRKNGLGPYVVFFHAPAVMRALALKLSPAARPGTTGIFTYTFTINLGKIQNTVK